MSNLSSTQRALQRFKTLPEWLRSNLLYRKPLSQDSEGTEKFDRWTAVTEADRATPESANVISSVLYDDGDTKIHLPLIDLDIEHFYVGSSTEGHGHLYINKQLTHEQYGKLLYALREAELIGEGIIKQYERDGGTTLRIPGVTKNDDLPYAKATITDVPPGTKSSMNQFFHPGVETPGYSTACDCSECQAQKDFNDFYKSQTGKPLEDTTLMGIPINPPGAVPNIEWWTLIGKEFTPEANITTYRQYSTGKEVKISYDGADYSLISESNHDQPF